MSVNIIMQVLNSVGYEPMYPFNPSLCLNAVVVDTSTASNYNLLITGVQVPLTPEIGNSLGIISFLPTIVNTVGATLSINGDTPLPITMADGTALQAGVFTTSHPVFLKYYNGGFTLLLSNASVGLSNVQNISPANMPISTATQNALNGKLNIPTIIPANSNLNAYQTAGMYYCPLDATAQSIANVPDNHAFSLLVQQSAGVNQTLTVYNYSNANSGVRSFQRVFYNGTWSSWAQIAFVFSGTGDPPSNLGQDGNIYIKYE